MIKDVLKRTASIFVFIVIANSSYGQILPPPTTPPPPNPVPITGIEWLIGGGAALGIRQFLLSRKNKK